MKYQLVIDSFIGPWAYSKQFVRNELKKFEGKHIDVLISSPGGSVDHGFAIMQLFIDHGDVTVYLSGMVASAATIIAMGAKRVVMTKASAFMVHQCSNYIDVWGSYNADQIQKLIDELTANKKDNEKFDLIIAGVYAEKCKKNVADILPVLKRGEWLTPQEALDFGFVDEIIEPGTTDPKLNLTNEYIDRLTNLGIPTNGLVPERFNFIDQAAPGIEDNSLTTTSNMKTYKFATVETLLKLDAIQVDKDGYVSVKAEDFEKINSRLAELEQSVKDKTDAEAAQAEELKKLKEQIKNLEAAPGDDTKEIEDQEGEKDDFTAHDLFNSIKSVL